MPTPSPRQFDASVRQVCTGTDWEHDPTVMSIARAHRLLRCPICGAERRLDGQQPPRT